MKTLSDHILDIVQNSINAKSTLIEIMVDIDKNKDLCFLKIVDNGCGMNKEMLEQATNPFFTTRKKGSGIGLSLSKQIMRLHKGSIHFQSDLNGTTFMLEF